MMRNRKNRKNTNRLTWLLFGAAVVLLAGSVAGSSRAALTYYNENYQANLEMSAPIGVTITSGALQAGTTGDAGPITTEVKNLVPGKKYPVNLAVENTGDIDAYVRVILRCYWKDKNGKRRDVDPKLIEKEVPAGWLEDASAATSEQVILYYQTPLKAGEAEGTATLVKNLSVNVDVAKHATWNTEGTTTTYDYDGLTLVVEAEADAVQTHSPAAAIESAWGKEVTLDGETITSVK